MKIKRRPYNPEKILKGNLFFLMAFLTLLIFTTVTLAQPYYGGTLQLGIEYQAYGFDAIESRMYNATSLTAASLVMERLFEMDPNGELKPSLGLSLTPSAGHKTYTIELRRGVTFHDRAPFNADAVVQHWTRLLDPKNRFRGLLAIAAISSVEKAGEFVVRFHLKHPWKPLMAALSTPNTITAMIPSPKAVAEGTHNLSPVGTGPFVFKSWKHDDHIILTKNANYWVKGKPYLDEIVIRMIPDANTRYAALISGEIDLLYTDRPSQIKKLTTNSEFEALVADGLGAGILVLNTRKPPLDDVRVRRALAHAWDQAKYINVVFKDTVPFATDWFGDTLQCGDTSYRYPDIGKAKTLIQEYGRPVEIEYLHSATQRGRESAMIVQQLFKPIGVTVTAVPLDWGAIVSKMFRRQFQMASWGIPSVADMGVVTRLVFYTKSPWNLSGYSNKAVDRLLIEQKMRLDQDAREKAWCEVVRQVNEDVPVLLICGRKYYMFKNPKVKGLPAPYNLKIRLADVWLDN